MDYYKGLEEIGKTGEFDKIPDKLLADYISDFTLELNNRRKVKNLTIPVVVFSEAEVCDCEPHTYYEWEKDENKCCECNKPIFKQT